MLTGGKSGKNARRPSWMDKKLLSSREKKTTAVERRVFFSERKKKLSRSGYEDKWPWRTTGKSPGQGTWG